MIMQSYLKVISNICDDLSSSIEPKLIPFTGHHEGIFKNKNYFDFYSHLQKKNYSMLHNLFNRIVVHLVSG